MQLIGESEAVVVSAAAFAYQHLLLRNRGQNRFSVYVSPAASQHAISLTLQALNVNAEGDGHGAQRTLSSPLRRHGLALAWPAILGIVLGGLVVIGLTSAVFARRRTRRAYQVSSSTPCSKRILGCMQSERFRASCWAFW